MTMATYKARTESAADGRPSPRRIDNETGGELLEPASGPDPRKETCRRSIQPHEASRREHGPSISRATSKSSVEGLAIDDIAGSSAMGQEGFTLPDILPAPLSAYAKAPAGNRLVREETVQPGAAECVDHCRADEFKSASPPHERIDDDRCPSSQRQKPRERQPG
jgi:hypothetical protein